MKLISPLLPVIVSLGFVANAAADQMSTEVNPTTANMSFQVASSKPTSKFCKVVFSCRGSGGFSRWSRCMKDKGYSGSRGSGTKCDRDRSYEGS